MSRDGRKSRGENLSTSLGSEWSEVSSSSLYFFLLRFWFVYFEKLSSQIRSFTLKFKSFDGNYRSLSILSYEPTLFRSTKKTFFFFFSLFPL